MLDIVKILQITLKLLWYFFKLYKMRFKPELTTEQLKQMCLQIRHFNLITQQCQVL
ncbi:unnamed protein product [Paramecium octaurelia]|uniref:Uncharacterized protein n=1 Tax=Paramecium octaurelia TaxID=43137 RepID=A0A8S1XA10_PAROT|nr:unnamed protein product [Paramecium octaurelia]